MTEQQKYRDQETLNPTFKKILLYCFLYSQLISADEARLIGHLWDARMSGVTILIHSSASLSLLIKWPVLSLESGVYPPQRAPPLQEVSYHLTQSEQGTDSQPLGSSTALMTLEPLDLRWHTPPISTSISTHGTEARPSQEGACTVSPHAHLYAMFEWPFSGSKDCWSAALPQGLCHFSLECGNTTSVDPKMQFTGDCFCMMNIPERPDAESVFRKEDK